MAECWSGWVVVEFCGGRFVGHAGRPVLRNWQVVPPKYRPTTLKLVGPATPGVSVRSSGAGEGSVACSFSQTSSMPKVRRLGTPLTSCTAGSGSTHWLYHA